MQQQDDALLVVDLRNRVYRARTREDWLNLCVLFLQEIAQKNHPKTRELGREIDFYLQLAFGDSDRIWEEAHRIAHQQQPQTRSR